MHEDAGTMFAQNLNHGICQGDIRLDKVVARIALEVLKGLAITGVGQLVNVYHLHAGLRDEMPNQVAPNESTPARDKNAHQERENEKPVNKKQKTAGSEVTDLQK